MKGGPDYIQFYPTLRCDKACGFCFNRGLPAMDDMELPAFKRMLGILQDIGVRTLDIMGGEPTLHPDIVAMVVLAEEAGLSVNISSNGSDLDVLGRISERNEHATVGISVNDQRELDAMRWFIERHHPVVKTVLRKGTGRPLVEAVLALEPKRYYLLYQDALHPDERTVAIPFDRFVEIVEAEYGRRVGTVFCSGFLPDTTAHPALARVRCPAGTTKLGILPDGSVYPCNLLFRFPDYLLGNILTDPFGDIWEHGRLAFFRSFGGNVCPRISCGLQGRCHGGCPAHSLAHRGALSAPEPRCVLQNPVVTPRKIV